MNNDATLPAAPDFLCHFSLHAGLGYLDQSRLRLLQAIRQHGTLLAAAEALKISYKTAWSWLDTMGNAASGPLVESVQGGAHGGASRLTPLGEKLLIQYENLCERHRRFMLSMAGEPDCAPLKEVESFLTRILLRTSARNQLHGTVERIWGDNTQAWVDVRIGQVALVTARVARSSVQELGLDFGSPITTLFKATCLQLHKPDFKPALRKGPFNRVVGKLIRSMVDEDFADAAIDIGEGYTLSGLIPFHQWEAMSPGSGETLCAWFDPDHVILAQTS